MVNKNHKKINNKVDLISLLFEKNGVVNEADQKMVDDWYFARAYVGQLNFWEDLWHMDAEGNRKVVVEGASPRTMAIIRELILRAHYMDFREEDKKNQSTIVILCDKGCKETTEKKLREAPFLSNYINYAWGADGIDALDFLEVKVEVKENNTECISADITEKAFKDISYEKEIDITEAKKANSIYCIGNDLYNLPDIRPEDVEMYEIPLRVFESEAFVENTEICWDRLPIKHKISNVFCTDTFPLRLKILGSGYKNDQVVESAIRKHILELSRCEHSRWVAEKLILGYKPWTAKHHYEYSILFGNKKQEYRKTLKNNEYHIDICSYCDLCRIDPQNRKFDTFLILSCLKE